MVQPVQDHGRRPGHATCRRTRKIRGAWLDAATRFLFQHDPGALAEELDHVGDWYTFPDAFCRDGMAQRADERIFGKVTAGDIFLVSRPLSEKPHENILRYQQNRWRHMVCFTHYHEPFPFEVRLKWREHRPCKVTFATDAMIGLAGLSTHAWLALCNEQVRIEALRQREGPDAWALQRAAAEDRHLQERQQASPAVS